MNNLPTGRSRWSSLPGVLATAGIHRSSSWFRWCVVDAVKPLRARVLSRIQLVFDADRVAVSTVVVHVAALAEKVDSPAFSPSGDYSDDCCDAVFVDLTALTEIPH
ncbi:hypothetical protein [Mycobacterium pseudokansasii]|uniref:hypothetical protein n=1 Tax=Mycobacterium pseudokansasii TaxID=2341080 RepID=UPI0010A964B7|nr:hypothetical protein [Mycobacterium pseudokansasii]